MLLEFKTTEGKNNSMLVLTDLDKEMAKICGELVCGDITCKDCTMGQFRKKLTQTHDDLSIVPIKG